MLSPSVGLAPRCPSRRTILPGAWPNSQTRRCLAGRRRTLRTPMWATLWAKKRPAASPWATLFVQVCNFNARVRWSRGGEEDGQQHLNADAGIACESVGLWADLVFCRRKSAGKRWLRRDRAGAERTGVDLEPTLHQPTREASLCTPCPHVLPVNVLPGRQHGCCAVS
jgi:hypothetical protein